MKGGGFEEFSSEPHLFDWANTFLSGLISFVRAGTCVLAVERVEWFFSFDRALSVPGLRHSANGVRGRSVRTFHQAIWSF